MTPRQQSSSELREVTCNGCGAPVPLAPMTTTICAFCNSEVALPVLHVDLFQKMLSGSAQLAQADAIWRRLPLPLPRWAPMVFAFAIVVVVLALTVTWAALLRSGTGLLGGPARSMVLIVIGPSFVGLQLVLELLAWLSPCSRLEEQFSAYGDERFLGIVRCRNCGAPLTLSEHSVVIRCSYCKSDNLVRRLRRAAFRHARELAGHGRRQIDDAIATLRTLQMQRDFVRWAGPVMMIPLFCILLVVLWTR